MSTHRTVTHRLALAVAVALALAPQAHAAGARLFKSGPIQITADGAWVWTVNPDDNSVSRLATATDTVTRYPLQDCIAPEGLSVREDGTEVWIACRDSDRLVVLAGLGASAGTPLATVELPRGGSPFGIALSRDQQLALVTLSRMPGIAVIDAPARRLTNVLDRVETTPLGVAFTEDGLSAWVTHLRRYADIAFLSRIDLDGPPTVGTELWNLPAAPLRSGSMTDPDPTHNVAEGGYLTFRGHLAQVPSVTGRNEMWIPTQYTDVHENSYPSPPDSTAQVSIRHLLLARRSLVESLQDKVIMTAAQVHDPRGTAWLGPGWDAHISGGIDVGFSADGTTTCVLNELSNDLLVFPTATPAFKPSAATPPLPEISVGARPMGVALSPVNDLAYVMNRLGDPSGNVPGRTVSVVDVAGLRELRQVSVAPETFSPEHLRGARLFHTSDDPRISVKQKVGCATCHPNGEDDASQWDLNVMPGAHGPRMVPSLLGLGLTMSNGEREPANGYGLLHHSGDRDEVQDFDFTFQGVQLGGTGFLGIAANPELGAPNAGRSPELDALADYVLSLPPIARSPHRAPNGQLTEAARRGATFFAGDNPAKPADAGCATCHDPRTAFVDHLFHDVGQGRPVNENEVNNRTPPWEFKTETLVGVWATPPYEGNDNIRGQSRDMMEWLHDVRGPIGHGRIDGLTGRQLRDFHDFILSIDGEMTGDEVLLARDTAPPHLERVEPVSLSMIAAWFDESIDPITAANPANWSVTDETGAVVPVTAAVVDGQNGDLVRLSVAMRAGCPPASYTVTPGPIKDLADRTTNGIANVANPADPRNARTFTIGDTITITLGGSGYEDLTIALHDAGIQAGGDATLDAPSLYGPGSPTATLVRGFIRFEWEAAFAAATGLPSSADIVDASYSLRPASGDAHDIGVRRVLLSWQDMHVTSRTPPPGSVSWLHHSTPSDSWNQGGASKMTAGVDGGVPSDYDGLDDVAATMDAVVRVRSVKERFVVSGPGVTDAFRFWLDHPAQDYGHAIELMPGDIRNFDFHHVEEGLRDDGPVLTITYKVRGGMVVPPEVSGRASATPMLVTKATAAGDSVRLSFEDLGPVASSYGVYAGDIGAWYSHASVTCGALPGASGGRRELVVAEPQARRYFLVTAANVCAEGVSGADSFGRAHPLLNLDCPP